ncbi:MAG: DNA polymerase IV [Acidaminobacteraceae bacterium]
MERIIMHVDLDAFFAAVEQVDNPELRGKPVIVGGGSDRGVVTTCSYEARKYGVHSAMAGFRAKQLCPNGIFVEVRMQRYLEVSKQVFKIINDLCDTVEKVSVDEAYMDFTSSKIDVKEIVDILRRRVTEETGLTISVGVSYNKFLAKLASDWNKPDGVKYISPGMIPNVLEDLNISKVHGIGKKGVEKFNRIGIFKIRDLLRLDREFMSSYMGVFGIDVHDRIRGIDNRSVIISHERKSHGRESTLHEDTSDKIKLKIIIAKFAKEIAHSMQRHDVKGRTITVKFKNDKFITRTKSKSLNHVTDDYKEISIVASKLIDEYDMIRPLRLIGLSIANFDEDDIIQISFFGD